MFREKGFSKLWDLTREILTHNVKLEELADMMVM